MGFLSVLGAGLLIAVAVAVVLAIFERLTSSPDANFEADREFIEKLKLEVMKIKEACRPCKCEQEAEEWRVLQTYGAISVSEEGFKLAPNMRGHELEHAVTIEVQRDDELWYPVATIPMGRKHRLVTHFDRPITFTPPTPVKAKKRRRK